MGFPKEQRNIKGMGIEQADGMSYAFDGTLVSANNQTVVIDCRVWPPLVSGDVARIELSVPNALMPLPEILNPCRINGQPSAGVVEVWLDDVWYRHMPQDRQPRRHAGSEPIALTHISKLRMTTRFNKPSENAGPRRHEKSVKFYLTSNAFLADGAWLSALSKTPNCQTNELHVVDIPQLGRARILREWVFARSIASDNAVVKSGFCAIVELGDGATQTTEEYLSHFEDALMVISIFCRQRIAVLGWEVEYDDRLEQVWKNPLEPLTTQYLPYEPHDYLVDQRSFALLTSAATKELAALDPNIKDIFTHMTLGLTPFINLQTSERFLSMFHALEACRVLAPEDTEDAESKEAKEDSAALKQRLEVAKQGVKTSIAKRIDGLIKKVGEPTLRKQLESVLGKTKWNVKTNDLWPLSGPDNLPGLKQVRDKLAHSGPKALHMQGLAVATWHLSILLERVLLTLLKIPIADTSAAPNRLMREPWYQPAYLRQQRELVIKADGGQ